MRSPHNRNLDVISTLIVQIHHLIPSLLKLQVIIAVQLVSALTMISTPPQELDFAAHPALAWN